MVRITALSASFAGESRVGVTGIDVGPSLPLTVSFPLLPIQPFSHWAYPSAPMP